MRVEFYLTDANEVSHFAPVARELLKIGVDACFVSPRNNLNWYDADAAEALMDWLRLPYVRFPSRNADLGLTTYLQQTVHEYRNLRARMMYGVNLTATSSVRPSARLWHVGFDLYLLHGPLSRRIAAQFVRPEQIRMIGYPRFDVWFTTQLDRQLIRQKYGVTSSKPVILYAPTWQHRSSIDTFADSIFALSDRFEILVKPHQLTYRREPERMRKLNSGSVRVLAPGPATAQEEAFTAADVVITDLSSGVLSDAIFLNQKMVVLARESDLDDLPLPAIRQEITLCLTPQDLSQKVDKALAVNFRSAELQELRKQLFDSTEGGDSVRAARMICEFVEEQRRRRWSIARTAIRWRKRRLTQICGAAVRRVRHSANILTENTRRSGSDCLTILLYHNVGPLPIKDPFGLTVAPDQFERQMRWLVQSGYETICPSDWLAARRDGKPLPERAVMLTFDDGYAELVEHALPVLRRYGLRAAVYVVTKRLGLTNTWDEVDGLRTMHLMTAEQICEWARQGIEFGSHTRTHPHLSALGEPQLTDEIDGSRDDLQTLLGVEVLSMAYPYGEGAESRIVREHLRGAYQLGMTIRAGRNPVETNPYELRRATILPSDSLQAFERKLYFGRTSVTRLREFLPRPIRTAARMSRRMLRERLGQ